MGRGFFQRPGRDGNGMMLGGRGVVGWRLSVRGGSCGASTDNGSDEGSSCLTGSVAGEVAGDWYGMEKMSWMEEEDESARDDAGALGAG